MSFARIEKEPSPGGLCASCVEGSSFSLSSDIVGSMNLSIGQELSEQEYFKLKQIQERRDCRLKALDALSRREHGQNELKQKLLLKGFSKEVIEMVLDELIEKKLLSDFRYATMFIESRQRKNPEGRLLMSQRLASKGIDRETVQKALDLLYSEEQTIEYVQKAYQLAKRKADEQKALFMLQKKGFSSYEIRLGLERLEG
ncbi:MAG: regulatory protein RecX [Spirochaetia bacterium]|nr:regulatory protein RecX [Spirochaetia bacterium]